MNVLTREQVQFLVGIFVIVLSALWPPLQPFLEVIAPSVVGLLLIVLGIPAIANAYVKAAQFHVEAARLQLAAQELKYPSRG